MVEAETAVVEMVVVEKAGAERVVVMAVGMVVVGKAVAVMVAEEISVVRLHNVLLF